MSDPSDEGSGESAEATRQRQRAIGQEIRRMFDDVVKEEVPGNMLDLLRQLDGKEKIDKPAS